MKVTETELPGVMIVEPRVFGDQRGFFVETYHEQRYLEAGIPSRFVQDNHSRSGEGVLRGLHYQLLQPQGKLVRVVRGCVFDVAVDVRRGSPSYGRWVAAVLDDDNQRQMYVPPGFAHGFCVLSEEADLVYKCTDYYHPESEQGIAWDDPDLAIAWPRGDVVLSAKDEAFPTLANQLPSRLPAYTESP